MDSNFIKKVASKLKTSEQTFVKSVELDVDSDVIVEKEKLKKEDFDGIETKEVTLKWSLYPEYRRWGLKSMYALVPDQTIELRYSVLLPNEETEIRQTQLELKNISIEYLENDSEHGIGLAPVELRVSKRKTVVVFQTSSF